MLKVLSTAEKFCSFTLILLCWLALPVSAAERVISLAPHNTELAYAAGLGDRLVAASAYSNYPEAAQSLEQVSSWQGINFERVVALKPDLILAWRNGNPQRVIDQFIALGIPVFYSDPMTIDAIAEDLRRLGQYSGDPIQANEAADALLAYQAELKSRYHRPQPVRAFLQLGTHPVFTSSSGTLQNEVLTLCGASNIFADSSVPWPQVSREQVLFRKPQVIISGGEPEKIALIKQFWGTQLDIPVIVIPEDWLHRSGPRIMQAADSLCQQLNQYFPVS